MADRAHLPIDVDARRADSDTTIVRNGAYVLTISTVLPERGLAVELHSTYVGHPASETLSTHLLLGADLPAPQTIGDVHDVGELDVLGQPRDCLYDHALRLQELLCSLGHEAALHIGPRAIAAVDAPVG
ncbi:MAG: hypothetical protein AB7R67_23805 [Vicinamibacterales bacterium]